jgi:hypothetical protein
MSSHNNTAELNSREEGPTLIISTMSTPGPRSLETFTSNVTSVKLAPTVPVTGIERIMLAAQGDLQRLLSSFLAQDIVVTRIYAHTSPRPSEVSPETPITQERRVQLLVGPTTTRKLACIATSTVTITSPDAARLFLDEHYAIGQCYRALGRTPHFTLHTVDAKVAPSGRRELRRTYTLETPGLKCDIEEIFPDRDMFDMGEAWLLPPAERPAHLRPAAISEKSAPTASPFDAIVRLWNYFFTQQPVKLQ